MTSDPITSATAVFDPSYLSDVALSLTPDRLTALLDSYFVHTDGQLIKIEALLASNDIEAIGPEAHALVGSSGGFGAMHFSAVARALEQAIKRRQFDAVPVLVVDLRKASDRASAALADWLKAQPGVG
jgi:HPt (histidine-containing phosphotransfer) domain-containing protein